MAKGKGGRPSKYREDFAEQARKLCMLGATDAEIADFFGVAESTVNNWKQQHPDFLESLKSGKSFADANVAHSLYRRATGWEHDAVKIVADAKTGDSLLVPYVEHYPGDTTAQIFWLKNRRPDLWRDKQNIEHSGELPVLVVRKESD
jgi:hypothetical protein